ncbi:DNA repair protein RecO [Desulfobacterales bacterium HSG16]|nr:DNA repair protein RecO [Desulfobacterales bacterium HSG16]
MLDFSTAAILLRKRQYQDHDLIISFFTQDFGKISVIAKYAKKSVKRFAGILEPFCILDLTCRKSKKSNLDFLNEAVLQESFSNIRSDVLKTAYASYWAELVDKWMEERADNVWLFELLSFVLKRLDEGQPPEYLSILFQIRFLAMLGFCPNLIYCNICGKDMHQMNGHYVSFDLMAGGLICRSCKTGTQMQHRLSKGSVKQLLWLVQSADLSQAERVKFSAAASKEGLDFLETFVPWHLGKKIKSLSFLRQIRR